jgi:glycosyltransferase involved in cell wall biosynthesis
MRRKIFFQRGPQFYAEYNIRLFFYLLFTDVDLIFANDLDTLPAAFLVSKLRKIRLIYDTHEYFTETPELVKRPFIQTIWKKIENIIFPRLLDIITVNDSIARLYGEKFKKTVLVSRNIPSSYLPEKLKTRKELELPVDKRIIILQGTGINIQRGAEEAVEAMQYIKNAVLLVAGSGDVLSVLKKMVIDLKLESKVIFRAKMSFTELRQYTTNCDLGLAIDKDTNMNYHYSLPNKLFDYIHSGIPTLSSGLLELKRIIDQYDIGYYIQNHDPKHIANVINEIFANVNRYNIVKENTKLAKKDLCWENEEKVLISVINKTA